MLKAHPCLHSSPLSCVCLLSHTHTSSSFCRVLALCNNVIEIRGDEYKMLFAMNPMVPRDERVGEERHHFAINLWVTAFTAVSYLSLVTNLLLLSCDYDSNQDGYQQ